jgi:MerR family copper efflux transcriptional regulator
MGSPESNPNESEKEVQRMGKSLFIGDVAKQLGLTVKTIRYYEGLGLLAEPERTESGYRIYDEQDAERLRFIKGAKALGLSLTEIKEILAIWGTGMAPCRHVEHLLRDKVGELNRRIEELAGFRDALSSYLDHQALHATASDVPCKHIEGATLGQWNLTPPDQILKRE